MLRVEVGPVSPTVPLDASLDEAVAIVAFNQ
jgi:hypothetical protein